MKQVLPAVAGGLCLLAFSVLGPVVVGYGDGRWRGRRGPNLNAVSVAVLLAGRDASDPWPPPSETAALAEVLEEAARVRRASNSCGQIVGSVLDEEQRAALPELAAGEAPSANSILTDPELHAALAGILKRYGTPAGEGALAPAWDPIPQIDLRVRTRGLRALVAGKGPGLRPDQARSLLPPCLRAELASGRVGPLDEAAVAAMPRAFEPFLPDEPGLPTGLTLPPVGPLDDSVLMASIAVLRQGPQLLSEWRKIPPPQAPGPGVVRPPPGSRPGGSVTPPPGAAPQPGR